MVYSLLDHKDSQACQEVTITLQYATDWIGCGRWWVVGTERSHKEAVATEIGLERFLCSVRLVDYQLELTSVWGHWTVANLVNKTNVAKKGVSNTGWTIYCMHFIKIIKDSISFWYNTPISIFFHSCVKFWLKKKTPSEKNTGGMLEGPLRTSTAQALNRAHWQTSRSNWTWKKTVLSAQARTASKAILSRVIN